MSIDVDGGREGTVSKPDLNLLHGDSFTEKQAGTSMPKVMEANLLEVILLDHPCEVFCHIIGSEKLSGLVDTDVVEVISTVGLTTMPTCVIVSLETENTQGGITCYCFTPQ